MATKGLTRTIRQAILDHLLGTGTWTAPAEIHIGLFTVAPTPTSAGTEVTTAGGTLYARVQHDNWIAATAAEPSVAVNDGDINFPQAGANWGDIVAFGIFSAALGGGTLLAYGPCTKTISLGDTAIFLDGQLSVTLDMTTV